MALLPYTWWGRQLPHTEKIRKHKESIFKAKKETLISWASSKIFQVSYTYLTIVVLQWLSISCLSYWQHADHRWVELTAADLTDGSWWLLFASVSSAKVFTVIAWSLGWGPCSYLLPVYTLPRLHWSAVTGGDTTERSAVPTEHYTSLPLQHACRL